eukprot:CAMPEP_0117585412 /NCGR_PEP_ID=MMETSP0784-20121206/68129_1 /TAXON_ID=39447 /ORGANISM="" /LENGTH=193 /DNA_ID=CAMNT_0005386353 /DNA_START=35 /DNA_END=616 /DNA_ORIENTATION=-
MVPPRCHAPLISPVTVAITVATTTAAVAGLSCPTLKARVLRSENIGAATGASPIPGSAFAFSTAAAETARLGRPAFEATALRGEDHTTTFRAFPVPGLAPALAAATAEASSATKPSSSAVRGNPGDLAVRRALAALLQPVRRPARLAPIPLLVPTASAAAPATAHCSIYAPHGGKVLLRDWDVGPPQNLSPMA